MGLGPVTVGLQRHSGPHPGSHLPPVQARPRMPCRSSRCQVVSEGDLRHRGLLAASRCCCRRRGLLGCCASYGLWGTWVKQAGLSKVVAVRDQAGPTSRRRVALRLSVRAGPASPGCPSTLGLRPQWQPWARGPYAPAGPVRLWRVGTLRRRCCLRDPVFPGFVL